MSKTKVRSVGLFLLAIGFALGAKCPEFPELEDIEITAIHEDMIEFKMEARGIINIDEDCDTYEISTAEILAELEELGEAVADRVRQEHRALSRVAAHELLEPVLVQ